MRIALVGPKGGGKSLLAYTFSGYLRHKGVSVLTVNMDSSAQRLSYAPDVDIRHVVRGGEVGDAYRTALKDELFQVKVSGKASSVVLLDCASGLDWLWFSSLPRFCDSVWVVSEEPAPSVLLEAVRSALEVPVLNVVNQRRIISKGQKTLSPFDLHAEAKDDAVFVNAWEREGFDKLQRAIL